jgi:hypothetical protein
MHEPATDKCNIAVVVDRDETKHSKATSTATATMATSVCSSFENIAWSLCLPIATSNDHTLGAAIETFEERVRKAGVVIDFTPPNGLEGINPSSSMGGSILSGKVMRLPKLVDLVISQALDYGKVPEGNVVGDRSNDSRAVVQGNVVALYVPTGKGFLYLKGKEIKYTSSAKMPLSLEWGRFLVVSAGPDRSVAFYNPTHRRFLAAREDGTLEASTCQAIHADDRPRAAETFLTGHWNTAQGGVRFQNKLLNKSYYMEVMQIRGFDF